MTTHKNPRPGANGDGGNDLAAVAPSVRRDPDKARARIRESARRELDALVGLRDNRAPRAPARYGLTDDELRMERGSLAAGKVVPDMLDGWALRATPPWPHREIDAVLVDPDRREAS